MAAEMLTRLGFECSVLDLFGDFDASGICDGRVMKIDELAQAADHALNTRMYEFIVFTGGLESSAAVAEKLAQEGRAAFASSESIKLLTCPDVFNEALAVADVNWFPFFQDSRQLDGPYVRKKIHHSGTAELVESKDFKARSNSRSTVFQKYIAGDSVSLIFVANQSGVQCLGGSEQLTESLSWVGSISGLQLAEDELQSAIKFAEILAQLSKIVGVFGIDFIRNQKGLCPVDINPRIPASAEVVGDHVISSHLRAFGIDCESTVPNNESVRGKLVVFNSLGGPVRFERNCLADLPIRYLNPSAEVSIADVPNDNEIIEVGRPVLTVFSSGRDAKEVRSKLSSLREEILKKVACYWK